MKTSRWRSAARATTAAASAALPHEAIARGAGAASAAGAGRAASRLLHAELQERPEEVARLVRAGHVAGLVLDPDAAAGGEPQGVGERPAAGERGGPEAVAVDQADLGVEPLDEGRYSASLQPTARAPW